MKHNILTRFGPGALLTLPALASAHHGDEETAAGQLLHVLFDPLHLGIAFAVAVGLYGLSRMLRRKGNER